MRTGGAQEGSRQPHRPGDIQVHPSVKWTRGRAWPTARPAGFPCPSAKQASLDSRVSTPSCWGRVPSRVSFTNARPAQVGSWTGARSEVTSWLPQPPPGASPWSTCPADRTRPLEAGPAVPGVGTTSGARSSLFQARAAHPPCVRPTPAQICFSSKQPAPPPRLQMAQEGHYRDVFPCLSAHDGTANTRRSPQEALSATTAILQTRGRGVSSRFCRSTAVRLPPPPLATLGGDKKDPSQTAAHPKAPGTSRQTR